MTLEELEIVVKANVEQATKELDNLKTQIGELDGKELQANFQKIDQASQQVSKSTSETSDSLKALIPVLTKSAGGSAKMGTAMKGLAGASSVALPVILAIGVGVAGAVVEFKILTSLIKAVFNPIIKVATKLLTTFANVIKTQVIQALNTLNSKMYDGLDNLVQVSKELNTALSSLKSSLTETGNALATAVAPVIQAVIPLMNNLLSVVTNLANGLAQITASLFGNVTTFKKAKKVNEDYAKSVAGTTKANKGMLASFDELNVIGQDNGGGGVLPQDMFEDVEIDSKILEFTNKLKELWNTDNIEGLENFGKEIGEKVNKQLDELPAYEWAKSIGEKINKALALVNGFLSTNPRQNIRQKTCRHNTWFYRWLNASTSRQVYC